MAHIPRSSEEFELPEPLTDCIDRLVDDGRLSSEDLKQLKMDAPASVLGWLSAELERERAQERDEYEERIADLEEQLEAKENQYFTKLVS
jgi:polyhydroxyalkanoate synthesis regulator phasin